MASLAPGRGCFQASLAWNGLSIDLVIVIDLNHVLLFFQTILNMNTLELVLSPHGDVCVRVCL